MKKTSLFKATEKSGNEILTQTEAENQNQGFTTQNTANLSNVSNTSASSKDSDGSVSLGGATKSSGVTNSNTQAPNTTESSSVSLAATNSKTLSGTTEYFGVLDIVSILGQKPEFSLQDSKGNYFVYYGEHLNFVQAVNALGGNVYEMVTETEILQNQLFGDRVSYINLSMFKDIRVIMVIEIDGDVWLLQIPAEKYHQSKDYLKSLFIQ